MTWSVTLIPARTQRACLGRGPWHRWLLSAAGLYLMAASTWAAPIPVANPSFETLTEAGLGEGCGMGCSYSVAFIQGWVNIPFSGIGLNSGQFRPGTDVGNTTYFNTLSDGPTSAYTSNGCIEQTVSATVQPGVTYTLQADVAWRDDAGPTGVPRLRVNNIYYDGVGTAIHGGWATYTATYVGQSQDAGMPITICLSSVSFQGNFDNVRLSDSSGSTGVAPVIPPPLLQLQARPNPFGAATNVRFSLTERSPVVLRVLDVSGRAVRTLLNATNLESGAHETAWDGRDDAGQRMGSGLYFLRIDTGAASRVERVLLIR